MVLSISSIMGFMMALSSVAFGAQSLEERLLETAKPCVQFQANEAARTDLLNLIYTSEANSSSRLAKSEGAEVVDFRVEGDNHILTVALKPTKIGQGESDGSVYNFEMNVTRVFEVTVFGDKGCALGSQWVE